jgi:hypothetical protein
MIAAGIVLSADGMDFEVSMELSELQVQAEVT